MQEINVVILEDDPLFQLKLKVMLHESEFKILKIFDNKNNLEEYIRKENVHLLICDIYIGKETQGVDVIKSLSKRNLPIVCTTASEEESIFKGLLTHVSGYLVKPFHKITLLSTLRKTIEEFKKNQFYDFVDRKYIMITGKTGKLEKIAFTDIIYLETEGNYTMIVTENSKYAKKTSMNKILLSELDGRFRRIHSKFAVNIQMIKSITAKNVTLINHLTYPISRNFKNNLQDLY